jgi:hypothetical protein
MLQMSGKLAWQSVFIEQPPSPPASSAASPGEASLAASVDGAPSEASRPPSGVGGAASLPVDASSAAPASPTVAPELPPETPPNKPPPPPPPEEEPFLGTEPEPEPEPEGDPELDVEPEVFVPPELDPGLVKAVASGVLCSGGIGCGLRSHACGAARAASANASGKATLRPMAIDLIMTRSVGSRRSIVTHLSDQPRSAADRPSRAGTGLESTNRGPPRPEYWAPPRPEVAILGGAGGPFALDPPATGDVTVGPWRRSAWPLVSCHAAPACR